MKTLEYKVVCEPALYALVDHVNQEIKNGWIPVGSIAITGNFYQAMIQEKEVFTPTSPPPSTIKKKGKQ